MRSCMWHRCWIKGWFTRRTSTHEEHTCNGWAGLQWWVYHKPIFYNVQLIDQHSWAINNILGWCSFQEQPFIGPVSQLGRIRDEAAAKKSKANSEAKSKAKSKAQSKAQSKAKSKAAAKAKSKSKVSPKTKAKSKATTTANPKTQAEANSKKTSKAKPDAQSTGFASASSLSHGQVDGARTVPKYEKSSVQIYDKKGKTVGLKIKALGRQPFSCSICPTVAGNLEIIIQVADAIEGGMTVELAQTLFTMLKEQASVLTFTHKIISLILKHSSFLPLLYSTGTIETGEVIFSIHVHIYMCTQD